MNVNSDEPVKMEKRRTDLLIGLIIAAVTLLLCLGGIELAGYIWERSTAQGPLGWALVASRRLDLQRHGDAERPYHLFEPGRNYLWRGIPVEINSRGLRDREYTVPKPDNIYRILNVGDSIVFGWEVQVEDTFGKRLENSLNGNNPGRQVEVINGAIPTWNLEAGRNFLLQEGLSYEPDLVIVSVTIVNDIYGHGPEALDEGGTLHHWLRENSYGWSFMTLQTRFLLARQYGPEAIPVLNPPQEARAYYPLQKDSPVWDRIWLPIEEMALAAQEQGVPLIIVAFPTAFQLNSLDHPDIPQQVLTDRTTAAGLLFIDLLPVYAQACGEAGGDACEGYENLLFADVWMHPNPFGHELAAQRIEVAVAPFIPTEQ